MPVVRCLTVAVALSFVASLVPVEARPPVELNQRGRFVGGATAATEIVAYDAGTRRLFVTNGAQNRIDVVGIANVDAPTLLFSIPVTGGNFNSVAARNGLVAAAVEGTPRTGPGRILLFSTGGTLLRSFVAGVQPDHVGFSPDGRFVISANEGELDGATDPAGSISIIDLANGVAKATITTLGFESFDATAPALRDAGVRIFPGRLPSVDFEPEYVAVSPDSQRAWVTLQEANSFAIVDLVAGAITEIRPIPLIDHSQPGNRLDASDGGGAGGGGPLINIANWPVFGMHMPDTVAAFSLGGATFYASAGEGDSRSSGPSDEVRAGASSFVLDPVVFPNAATLKTNSQLGRLTVSNIDGNLDADAEFERIHVFGSRSFSIFDASGTRVFDSGEILEQITAAAFPTAFNSTNDANNSFDTRSDNKGPEPEALAIGLTPRGRTLAFVGLERIGGIATFDISTPAAAQLVDYVNNRDFTATIDLVNAPAAAGDLGPESIVFISAADSPTGEALIAVANEISGTTTLYSVDEPLLSDGFE